MYIWSSTDIVFRRAVVVGWSGPQLQFSYSSGVPAVDFINAFLGFYWCFQRRKRTERVVCSGQTNIFSDAEREINLLPVADLTQPAMSDANLSQPEISQDVKPKIGLNVVFQGRSESVYILPKSFDRRLNNLDTRH